MQQEEDHNIMQQDTSMNLNDSVQLEDPTTHPKTAEKDAKEDNYYYNQQQVDFIQQQEVENHHHNDVNKEGTINLVDDTMQQEYYMQVDNSMHTFG